MAEQPNSTQPVSNSTAPCARCGDVRLLAHMECLKTGRFLCQRCVAVLRGLVNPAAGAAPAQPTAAAPSGTGAAPTAVTTVPAVEPELVGQPSGPAGDPLDLPDLEVMDCPKCGADVIFGLPMCEECGVILDDYWSEQDVLHPESAEDRRWRLLKRAAVFAGLVAVVVLAWPTKPEQTRWESIQELMAVGPGERPDEISHGVQIHPTIQRVGRLLVIQNNDAFDWGDVEIKLNAMRGGLQGYSRTLTRIRYGQRKEVSLINFERRDGTQFPTEIMPITRIDIRADTPEGPALWMDPEYVDVTKAQTVD